MLDLQLPKITSEQSNDLTGTFVVEPLDRGLGHTFGNSLRRILLSSLEGAAVSLVRIEGIAHEFSMLPGIKEDVTDIILNMKGLVCRLHGAAEETEVTLTKKGPGLATAGDIQLPSDLEILNPELVIATLSKGAHLEMTLTIRKGRGYVSAEGNRPTESVIGVIPVDSIFSPIERVSYKVDRARIGQRTDFDKLTLEIATNGSISPQKALQNAAEELIRSLSLFTDSQVDPAAAPSQPEALAEGAATTAGGYEEVAVEELEIGVRSYNCLRREGIHTIGDLIRRSEKELINIPNFGRKSIQEVKAELQARGLSLRQE